jgi:hypothetical protein
MLTFLEKHDNTYECKHTLIDKVNFTVVVKTRHKQPSHKFIYYYYYHYLVSSLKVTSQLVNVQSVTIKLIALGSHYRSLNGIHLNWI